MFNNIWKFEIFPLHPFMVVLNSFWFYKFFWWLLLRFSKMGKIWECLFCQLVVYNRTTRKIYSHLRSHTNKKPFNCRQCDTSYKENNYLQTQSRPLDMPCWCTKCHQFIYSRCERTLHLKCRGNRSRKSHFLPSKGFGKGHSLNRKSKLLTTIYRWGNSTYLNSDGRTSYRDRKSSKTQFFTNWKSKCRRNTLIRSKPAANGKLNISMKKVKCDHIAKTNSQLVKIDKSVPSHKQDFPKCTPLSWNHSFSK